MTPALPAGCEIALIGNEDSGKEALARALAQRLAQRGIAASLLVEPAPGRAFDAGALDARCPARILLVAPVSPTPMDDLLRRALMDARLSFAVVHGEGAEQLANAWNAINAQADADSGGPAARESAAAWAWTCEKCSDPACEHRLFSDLVARRAS